MRWAFVDESKAKGFRFAVVIVSAKDAQDYRKLLKSWRLKGQQRIHFVDEKPGRRKQLLTEIAKLNLEIYVLEPSGQTKTNVRERCLEVLGHLCIENKVSRLIIEPDQTTEQLDRRVIARQLKTQIEDRRFSFDHFEAKHEPLLWFPDAVAWTYTRGGEYQSHLDQLKIKVIDID